MCWDLASFRLVLSGLYTPQTHNNWYMEIWPHHNVPVTYLLWLDHLNHPLIDKKSTMITIELNFRDTHYWSIFNADRVNLDQQVTELDQLNNSGQCWVSMSTRPDLPISLVTSLAQVMSFQVLKLYLNPAKLEAKADLQKDRSIGI